MEWASHGLSGLYPGWWRCIGRDNVPQEGDLGFQELALVGVEGKASVTDALENRCQVVQEVRVISAEHNNVILVD